MRDDRSRSLLDELAQAARDRHGSFVAVSVTGASAGIVDRGGLDVMRVHDVDVDRAKARLLARLRGAG